MFRNLILAASVALVPSLGLAQSPSVTTDGNGGYRTEYAPGWRGNVVGGGHAVVSGVDEQRPVLRYESPARAQSPGVTAVRDSSGASAGA